MDEPRTPADRMRAHAGDDQHLYGQLMRAMATDWEEGGPVREICRGWDDAPAGAVIQLRLLGGLFRIVLTGRAPDLVRFYPCLGGFDPPDQAWPAVRAVLAAHVAELHQALEIAPQTNEVGRSSALLVGLFTVVRESGLTSVRLLEPGASGGLNLILDRFHFTGEGWSFGPDTSPVRLTDIVGPVQPVGFEIVDRRGCDLAPVDVTSDEGRLRLRSFVWPFHVERYELLAAALNLAATDPPKVDRASAGEWLEQRLAEPVSADMLTVVWHSVTRMYWPDDEVARVNAAVERAGNQVPVAHVTMEYPTAPSGPSSHGAVLTTQRWGDDTAMTEPVVLARVGDHGKPVTVAPVH